VALWGANSPEWVVADLAVLVAGGVVVPLNHRYRLAEVADIVERADCRIVLADGGLPAAEAATLDRRRVLGLTGGTPAAVPRLAELAAAAAPRIGHRVRPDDVSHIQFTSGTTGRPKGALLVHRSMVVTTARWIDAVGLGPGDRYPVVAPFSHLGGHKTGIVACLLAGATLRPMPALDLDRMVELVGVGAVSVLQGPPAMLLPLLDRLEEGGVDTSGVAVVVTGAAAVPADLVHRLRRVLGQADVVTAYGLTEATGVCTMTRRGDPVPTIATTCGRPIEGVEVRVVDPGGRAVAPGRAGEVEVRGDGLMAGYLDDPEATAEAVVDGWLRTGDVGTLDDAGNLSIVDRLKDVVVVGGLNVYPAEVERVLADHPAVAAAAVVGEPHQRMGEVPVAFVVPAGRTRLVPEELLEHCRRRLAPFKLPRRMLVAPTLPHNAAGKVDKQALRASLAGTDVTTPQAGRLP
jgi:acyl-CoA synthetase (AMP-forming)/AMP-acid ligase II